MQYGKISIRKLAPPQLTTASTILPLLPVHGDLPVWQSASNDRTCKRTRTTVDIIISSTYYRRHSIYAGQDLASARSPIIAEDDSPNHHLFHPSVHSLRACAPVCLTRYKSPSRTLVLKSRPTLVPHSGLSALDGCERIVSAVHRERERWIIGIASPGGQEETKNFAPTSPHPSIVTISEVKIVFCCRHHRHHQHPASRTTNELEMMIGTLGVSYLRRQLRQQEPPSTSTFRDLRLREKPPL